MKKLAVTLKKHFNRVLHASGAAHLRHGYVERLSKASCGLPKRALAAIASRGHFIAICALVAGRLQHLSSSSFVRVHHA